MARRFAAGCGLVCVALSGMARTGRAGEWELGRPAGQFDRSGFTDSQDADRVRKAGNLAGVTKPNEWFHIAGWAEYDVELPQAGWYEFLVAGDAWGVEDVIDGSLSLSGG